MNNKEKYEKPTREDYISFFNRLINEKNGYVHFTITGIFDRSALEHNKNMYRNKWWAYQKYIRTFFRIIARKVSNNRDWGKIYGESEMKVIIIPEIQDVLHLHGVMSIHKSHLTGINYDTLREWLKQLWDNFFSMGSFDIGLFDNDGWFRYITKRLDYGDSIFEEFMILPPFVKK